MMPTMMPSMMPSMMPVIGRLDVLFHDRWLACFKWKVNLNALVNISNSLNPICNPSNDSMTSRLIIVDLVAVWLQ